MTSSPPARPTRRSTSPSRSALAAGPGDRAGGGHDDQNQHSTGTPERHARLKSRHRRDLGEGLAVRLPAERSRSRSSYATNAGAKDGRLQVRAIYNTLP